MGKPANAVLTQKNIKERIYKYVVWTTTEKQFRDRLTCFCGRVVTLAEIPVTKFSDVLEEKLKESCMGCFLKHLNPSHEQTTLLNECKLDLVKHEWHYELDETTVRNNNLCDDMVALIQSAVDKNIEIDRKLVHSMLKSFRLVGCRITELDAEGFALLRNLMILALSFNWMQSVPAAALPRKLRFLELFANMISDVASLVDKAPPFLLHLGLGRNKLTDKGNNIHLLATSLTNLRTLDLSNNDLCDLMGVLRALVPLTHLAAFSLIGNPCSKVLQTYHLEFELPLLDPAMRQPLEPCEPEQTEPEQEESLAKIAPKGKREKTQSKAANARKSKTSAKAIKTEKSSKPIGEKASGKSRGESSKTPGSKGTSSKKKREKKMTDIESIDMEAQIEEQEEEVAKKREEADNRKNMYVCLSTARLPWAKVIQFPEPALEVPAPSRDLVALRDTLRSKVRVRIVYMKWMQPPAKKTPKKKKNKEQQEAKEQENVSQETILSQTVVAQFTIPLQQVDWSETSVDYSWDAGEKRYPPREAVPVPSGLKKLSYLNAGGKKERKSKKDKGKGMVTEKPLPLPSTLTCHLGFGLRRVQEPVPELPARERPDVTV